MMVMSRITRDLEDLMERKPALWPGWLPMVVLPAAPFFCGINHPRWVLMWTLALLIFAGCKWLTWWEEGRWMKTTPARGWAYLLAWPGMNVREFLGRTIAHTQPSWSEWVFASAKTCVGAIMVWGLVRRIPAGHELWAGWTGLVGLVFLLHFGLFHLLALFWQRAGVNALPIMCAPVLAKSVAEFWNRRWNVAFNQLVHRFVFRPLASRANLWVACLAAFLVSGVIHDLVISVPAGRGYGLPTAYFLVQGCAVLFEHSRIGRHMGLRGGWRGWVFTMIVTAGPAFWLFHPPFIKNVILPMLTAIGATGRKI
jgi:hypothetical protein